MAEAALTMVLTKLSEMATDEVNLHLNAEAEVQKLSEKLRTIQKVLADAEQKGLSDPKVKSWLDKLRDIAYDIDDVLDEWTYELLKQKFEKEEVEGTEDPSGRHHPWEKVISFLQSVCLCFKHVVERRKIAAQVRELNGRLDSVREDNEREFNFVPDVTPVTYVFKPVDSTSQIDSSEVKGREMELKDLENKLLGDTASTSSGTNELGNNKSDVQVISIVGSGGMGKTTLAQLAFQQVKHHFKETAWVCVSDPFDEIKIAKSILEALNKSSPDLTQLDPLLRRIGSAIENDRFLIVLDDVWLEDKERWKPFWNSLKGNGAPGSRILVTTRSTTVAKTMGSSGADILELGPLHDSYCWSILSRLAFYERNPTDCEMLEEIGRLIANKCKGLPLAAKIVGSHLSSANSLEEWENVLKSDVWKWEKADTHLFPILKMSYSKLDPASKRCFSYCAMFPKDYEFNIDLLKRLWMAQSFVPGRNASEVEINARKIFDDLAARSFFQDFKGYGIGRSISSGKMHDIIHDFAIFLTEKECFTLELDDQKIPSKPCSFQNARHVMVMSNTRTPVSFNHVEKLRTIVLGGTWPPENLFNLLKRTTRVLLLPHFVEVVPEEVGNMIHLRFLRLHSYKLLELPGTICNLFQLQTLDILRCGQLCRFPQGIHKLQNLRHLIISERLELPQGLEKLINLRTLMMFGASNNNNNKLGYLKNMEQIEVLKMTCKGLNKADDVREAERANLQNKKFLQRLRLDLLSF